MMSSHRHRRRSTARRIAALGVAALVLAQCADPGGGAEPVPAAGASATVEKPAPDPGAGGDVVPVGNGVVLDLPEPLEAVPVGAPLLNDPGKGGLTTCVGDPVPEGEAFGACRDITVLTGVREAQALLPGYWDTSNWPCLADDPYNNVVEEDVTFDPEPAETGTEQVGELTAEWTRWEADCGDGRNFAPEQWWFPEVGTLVYRTAGGPEVAEAASGVRRDSTGQDVLDHRAYVSAAGENAMQVTLAEPNDYGWEPGSETAELAFTDSTTCLHTMDVEIEGYTAGNYGEFVAQGQCAALLAELEEVRAEAEELGIEEPDPLVAVVYDDQHRLISVSPQFRS